MMLSWGEQETNRAKVWKWGAGLDETGAPLAEVRGIGVAKRKGVQKAVWLVKLGEIG